MNIFGKLFIGAVSLGAAAIATGILMKKKRESCDANYSDDLPLHEDCCGGCGDDCCCNAEEGANDCCQNAEACADDSCSASGTADQDVSPAGEGSTTNTAQQAEASDESENDSTAAEDPAPPRS